MAGPFRYQHRKTARHQPRRQRPVFGLRHLRATQHVLRRGMRDHRQPERPFTRRPKQDGMRRGVRVGRRHQPGLRAMRLPLRALRTKRRLRGRGQDSDEEIARRLAKARDEIAAFGRYYDYCVVNEDVKRAGDEAQAIVIAIRCSAARRRPRVEELLASFGGKD